MIYQMSMQIVRSMQTLYRLVQFQKAYTDLMLYTTSMYLFYTINRVFIKFFKRRITIITFLEGTFQEEKNEGSFLIHVVL